MFEYLSGGREMHLELVKIYWVLLVPYVVFGDQIIKDRAQIIETFQDYYLILL